MSHFNRFSLVGLAGLAAYTGSFLLLLKQKLSKPPIISKPMPVAQPVALANRVLNSSARPTNNFDQALSSANFARPNSQPPLNQGTLFQGFQQASAQSAFKTANYTSQPGK